MALKWVARNQSNSEYTSDCIGLKIQEVGLNYHANIAMKFGNPFSLNELFCQFKGGSTSIDQKFRFFYLEKFFFSFLKYDCSIEVVS